MEYRGYKIEKFYSNEAVPKHIVKQYYQSEKLRIDRIIEAKELKEKAIQNGFEPTSMDDDLNDFLSMLN